MKRLYFLRHAKSDWKNPGLSDHERPLNGRGKRACAKMAKVFSALDITPDVVLCSTAERTRETACRVMNAGGFNWDIRYENGLYGASADNILAHVRALSDEYQSALTIGHNPGTEDLVKALTHNEAYDGMLARLSRKYPTGALACLEFDAETFADITLNSGRLQRFVKPKDTL